MTDSQKLDLLLSDMQDMKSDMQGMKDDMQNMKDDIQSMKDGMQGMKDDIQGLKDDMQGMEDDMQNVKDDMQGMKNDIQNIHQRLTRLELHLENKTDKNVQLIAENFIELTKKLNQAIPAADKNLAYEVKVNYLLERVDHLEKEVAEIKNQIA